MKIKKLLTPLICLIILCVLFLLAFHIKPLIVMSGSMEPSISTGSVCFVSTKTKYDSIEEDDIITYNLLTAKITHRVVEINKNGLITKGDSNTSRDLGYVTPENYYGKVLWHIPFLGYAIYFLRKNIVFVVAAMLIFCITYSFLSRPKKKGETFDD